MSYQVSVSYTDLNGDNTYYNISKVIEYSHGRYVGLQRNEPVSEIYIGTENIRCIEVREEDQ